MSEDEATRPMTPEEARNFYGPPKADEFGLERLLRRMQEEIWEDDLMRRVVWQPLEEKK